MFLVLSDKADQGLIAGFFVRGGPQNHFGEDGSEPEALGRKGINHFSTVGGIWRSGNDAVFFQTLQTIGQDVGGDTFVRVEKFFEGAVAEQHHVANNQ